MVRTEILLIVGCMLAVSAAMPHGIPGGVSELSGKELKEAEKTLQKSLTKLAAGDGPHYTISKIHSATVQIVAGSLHKFIVDLVDQNNVTKNCKVSIWSQPWLDNGIQVTFECEGEEKVVKKHSA